MGTLLRALIVEDSKDDAVMLLRELRRAGYEVIAERVETAEGMNAALDRAEWDVVLSDYSMPHFSALAALALLKTRRLDVPFIIISGTIGEETAVNAMKAGAQDFMVKGSLARLAPALERELREAQVRQERRRAEEALRRSETYLAAGERLTHSGSWSWNFSSGQLFWSQETYRIFGFDPEKDKASLRDTFLARVHPEDRPRIEAGLRNPQAQEEVDYRIALPDGSIRHIHEIAYLVTDATGKAVERFGVACDVTERKQAEDTLRESEERFRQIAETIDEVFWVADQTIAKMLYISPAYARVWGRSTASLYENPRSFLDSIHLDDRERVLAMLEFQKTGQPFDHEYRIVRPDGTLRWIWDRGFPVRDEAGQVTRYTGVAVDITERKLAEAENERLAAVVNSSDDAICSTTREGLIATWNAGAERMYGYSAEEIKGKHFSVLIPADRRDEIIPYEERLNRGEALQRYEIDHVRKDGSPMQVSVTLSPIKDAAGVVTGLSAIARDITERKRAEEALRESAAGLAAAQRIAHIGSWHWNVQTDTAHWSAETFRIFGLTPSQLVDHRRIFLELIHPADRTRVDRALTDALTGTREYDLEYRIRLADGTEKVIHGQAEVLRDAAGNPLALRGINHDITERKQAEAENARLVTAIEQSAEGVVMTNTAGEIEYVNPAFTHITGYSREEALGQNPRILKSGEQDPAFYQNLWTTILKGEVWHGELINRRKDGKFYTEEMNVTPVRGAAGEITHFIATKQDVTERKQLENQLRQAQKMEAVGRLAGGVAHDFNNVLTIINGYSDMVMDRLHSSDPMRGQIEEIRKAGDRAAALTRQLLAFSRQQVLAPRVLNLNTVLADIEKMLRRLMGEDVDLALVRDSTLGQVKADPGQIDQILMNLAVNARDAMPQGGKFVMETANAELDKAYADGHGPVPSGRYVMLAVSDTGIGMDAQIQAHIFEPFFTTKEKGKGTGLGLATVYGIVKQSGGFIWVYSEPGRGTTFKIYLPRVDEVAESVQAAEAQDRPLSGAETILLVEDEEALRVMAVRILKDCGYKVLESTSPEDALQIGEQHQEPIHLLLTDVVMPRMSGRKIAERFAFLRPAMKVLYMSGYTDDSIVRHGVLEPGIAFLQKPFTPATLVRKVREVLDAAHEDGS